ncbi:MAG: YggU family protein [Sterolibacterium sp.]|jgi:uncharacterized protein (TIGR00251 family)|nr:YggU family protein [Sterolibacterium sp.]
MNWLRVGREGVTLNLHIQPGAKKTAVAGLHGDALKIRLAAPPVDGKANEALLSFLAAQLDVAKQRVELISGASSRSKRVYIDQLDADSVAARLLRPLQTKAAE